MPHPSRTRQGEGRQANRHGRQKVPPPHQLSDTPPPPPPHRTILKPRVGTGGEGRKRGGKQYAELLHSHGLQNKLAIAASVSSEQMIAVAAGSKLQPVLKFLFFDEKIPVEHEVFNVLVPVLHAIPAYFALNVSLADDGTVSGPAMDRSQVRAKKFKFSGLWRVCPRTQERGLRDVRQAFGRRVPRLARRLWREVSGRCRLS